MIIRRAAGEAGWRLVRVLIAAGVVMALGLLIFNHDRNLPDWVWRIQVQREFQP